MRSSGESSRTSTGRRVRCTPARACSTTASSIRATRASCSASYSTPALKRNAARCDRSASAWRAPEGIVFRKGPNRAGARPMIYTEQHLQLQDSLRRFLDAEVNPHVDEWEAAGTFPARELFRKMGKLGFLGVTKPVEYGGAGLDYSYSVALAEALGHARCGGVPMAIGVQTDMATPALARFGSDEVKREFLAPSIAGDMVACLGVSEVGAGSDVASIRTTARKDGGDYVIRGGKMWTTNGTQADWMCLLANTSEGAPHRNKTLICLPMDTPGIEIARKLNKAGMRASDTAQIFFDDVRVPQRYRIGEEGMGFAYQMMQFQEERLWAAASAMAASAVITETIDYLRERQAFGQPLLANQFIYFKLAELNTDIECVRAL